MKLHVIKFSKFFDRSISTRTAIENLFSFELTDINEVTLDFAEIDLISASAAHQIVIESRRLEENHIKVNMINLDNHVNRMLELSRSDRKNILTVQSFERFSAKTNTELSNFLLGC